MKRWTKAKIGAAVHDFIKGYGRYPKSIEFRDLSILPYKERKWTCESCLAALNAFCETHTRWPTQRELRSGYKLPGYAVFRRVFGKHPMAVLSEHFPELGGAKAFLHTYCSSREGVLRLLDAYVKLHGKLPGAKDCSIMNQLAPVHVFKKFVGMTVVEYCAQAYPELERARSAERGKAFKERLIDTGRCKHWSCEDIEEGVEQFIRANGRLPKANEYRLANGLPCVSRLKMVCGITVGQLHKRYRAEYHLEHKRKWTLETATEAIERFAEENGRYPTVTEMRNKNGLPSSSTVSSLAQQSAARFIEQLRQNHLETEEVTEDQPSWGSLGLGM